MKILIILHLTLLPFLLQAQNIDSSAIKTIDSISRVSRQLIMDGEFDEALTALAPAEKIALEKLGRESLSFGVVSNLYGTICFYKGELEEACNWFMETKDIREKIQGRNHPDYATIINNLASVYWLMGKYDQAEPLYLESKEFREKTLGKDHADYAASIQNLGALYVRMGQYEKGEQYMLEANERIQKAWGSKHPKIAENLLNLGGLYQAMGDYEKAERYLLQAKTIYAETIGTEHPDYASCLKNLANIYKLLGDYGKSEALYLEALAILEKSLGTMHDDYASLLINLALLYGQVGKTEKQEELYLQALAIEEHVLGKEDPNYGYILQNLGIYYHEQENYDKAEPLYLQVLSIREKALGKEHPDYASSLHNLGILYFDKGQYEKAEELLTTAKNIREKALGNRHPDYVESLDGLASLYAEMGEYEKASHFYEEAEAINQGILSAALNFMSEPELARYLKTWPDAQSKSLSFTQRSLADASANAVMASSDYDNILFYKGYLLNASIRLRKLAATNPASLEQFNLLKSFGRRLAEEYAKPLEERYGIIELEEKATSTEKELARMVAGFAEATKQVRWQEVQQHLKTGEAAIEFVHYKFLNPKSTDSTMYAALVLLPGVEHPQFIPLFEEQQLEKLLELQVKSKTDWVSQLYTDSSESKSTLYELVWQPMNEALAEVQTIYFSPTGLLHRLNFGAIAMPSALRGNSSNGNILADRFQLIKLESTRQLAIAPQQSANINGNDAILFGGIKYDMDTTAIVAANSRYDASSLASRSRGLGLPQPDSTLRGDTWKYLSWTNIEVKAVETILAKAGMKAILRKEYEATEEAFKSIGVDSPSPRILHLATHGFFFPDPKSRKVERLVRDDEPAFKKSEHPMIRSGLLLAGGNFAWQMGHPAKPGMEDGILTAYEISQMNLKNTELVVLSACETGLGDIQGNEGVYGLQRAFKIAGAKYLIMSLWQVPDYQTQQLMTTFYRKWLNDKMTIPDAFRSAQQAMREKFKDPFLWAGFVLVE